MVRHVFLSFVAEDLQAVNLFRGQAKNKNSNLSFDDYSVKAPYNSANSTYIKSQIAEKIRLASVTIVLIGQGTAASPWVNWEIDKSYELGNTVFGVQLASAPLSKTPASLVAHRAKVLRWDVAQIVNEIG